MMQRIYTYIIYSNTRAYKEFQKNAQKLLANFKMHRRKTDNDPLRSQATTEKSIKRHNEET